MAFGGIASLCLLICIWSGFFTGEFSFWGGSESPEVSAYIDDSGYTLSAQNYVINDWPGGVHLYIPENVTIHVGNATARVYEVNGTIVLEGIRIK
jgi:hypothetical protein